MPSSTTKSKTTSRKRNENPAAGARSRKPLTREQALARSANEYALKGDRPSFGAPVSAQQVLYYEAAVKALRKSKPLALWLGFQSGEKALRALRPVAQGDSSSRTLSAKTKEAFKALDLKLDALHRADGSVNKTWPRKHAIVLVALLSQKPTRKPAAKKAASKTQPAPATPTPSVETPAAA